MAFEAADAALTKVLVKLIGRIERVFVPVGSVIHSPLPEMLETFVKDRVKAGEFYFTSEASAYRLINYDAFYAALYEILAFGKGEGYIVPQVIVDDVCAEKHHQEVEEKKNAAKETMRRLQSRNGQPVLPGKWHKEPYPRRIYERLEDYSITTSVSAEEAAYIRGQLDTPKEVLDGFFGQAYNYDDHGLTEEWMITFNDGTSQAPSDDDVIRVQCSSLLDILTVQVQDRVNNEVGVLRKEPIDLFSGKLKEAQVWGIDCYTRRMIEIAIEDRVPKAETPHSEKDVHSFLSRVLGPAINRQPYQDAHSMLKVTESILQSYDEQQHSTQGGSAPLHDSAATSPSVRTEAGHAMASHSRITRLDAVFTRAIKDAATQYGLEMFRIHPKGTGIICTAPEGIGPHQFVSEYLGDIYPPYRWCERLDVVEQAQEKYRMKPTLPDFYNILLERPRQAPGGYGLLFVDASQKSNMGSSCSHSCDANTTAAVVARHGKLTIALTTVRHVHPGEELTMDYSAMTTSDIEWRAAICLCGSPQCRGSFLHYATQDDLQQVMNQNCGPLWRYASLLKSCSDKPFSADEQAVLDRHGFGPIALGSEAAPGWLKKYAASNLKFLEFERKALPCALLRPQRDGSPSPWSYAQADLDARSVMEQRLQSLVNCCSVISKLVERHAHAHAHAHAAAAVVGAGTGAPGAPLYTVGGAEAAKFIWQELQGVPSLLEQGVGSRLRKACAELSVGGPVAAVKAESSPAKQPQPQPQPQQEEQEASVGAQVDKDKENDSNGVAPVNPAVDAGAEAGESMGNKRRHGEQEHGQEARRTSRRVEGASAGARAPSRPTGHSAGHAQEQQEQEELPAPQERLMRYEQQLHNIRELLVPAPGEVTLPRVKLVCLGVRACLQQMEDLSNSTARLALLADILVLWANTNTFSKAQKYPTVLSRPIPVVARDLGMCVPKAKVTKSEPQSRRLKATSSSSSSSSSSQGQGQGQGQAMPVDGTDSPTAPTSTSTSTSTSTATSTTNTTVREFAKDALCDPNEVVLVGQKRYAGHFMFEQLMAWFTAGGDEALCSPDILGCVQLPTFAMCFGSAASAYGATQREAFLEHLESERAQSMPWPAAIKDCFDYASFGATVTVGHAAASDVPGEEGPQPSSSSSSSTKKGKGGSGRVGNGASGSSGSSDNADERSTRARREREYQERCRNHFDSAIYGSPMLDVALGQAGAVTRALEDLLGGREGLRLWRQARDKARARDKASSHAHGMGGKGGAQDAQFDSILPPEENSEWVQCEQCLKWRRLPWDITAESLPDPWTCALSSWSTEANSCDTPQDGWDPDREAWLETSGAEAPVEQDVQVGQWKDVYCVQNCCYYEARVEQIKSTPVSRLSKKIVLQPSMVRPRRSTGGTNAAAEQGVATPSQRVEKEEKEKEDEVLLVRFHFKGWSSKHDEWVPLGEYVDTGIYGDEGRQPRVAPLNLYTNTGASNPREQERWQGAKLAIKEKEELLMSKNGKAGKGKGKGKSKGKPAGGHSRKGVKRDAGTASAGTPGEQGAAESAKKVKKTKAKANKIDWSSVIY